MSTITIHAEDYIAVALREHAERLGKSVNMTIEKGERGLVDVLSKYDELVVSPVVLGEYSAGISETKKGRESQAVLEQFLEMDC